MLTVLARITLTYLLTYLLTYNPFSRQVQKKKEAGRRRFVGQQQQLVPARRSGRLVVDRATAVGAHETVSVDRGV